MYSKSTRWHFKKIKIKTIYFWIWDKGFIRRVLSVFVSQLGTYRETFHKEFLFSVSCQVGLLILKVWRDPVSDESVFHNAIRNLLRDISWRLFIWSQLSASYVKNSTAQTLKRHWQCKTSTLLLKSPVLKKVISQIASKMYLHRYVKWWQRRQQNSKSLVNQRSTKNVGSKIDFFVGICS